MLPLGQQQDPKTIPQHLHSRTAGWTTHCIDLYSVLVLLNCERASGQISFCDDETCISLSTSKPNGASELGFSKSLPANWKVKNYAGLQVIYIRFTQAKFAKELCLRSHVVLRNLSENAAQQSQENKRFMFTVQQPNTSPSPSSISSSCNILRLSSSVILCLFTSINFIKQIQSSFVLPRWLSYAASIFSYCLSQGIISRAIWSVFF